MPVSRDLLEEMALTPKEYEEIVRRLGREPNLVELGMFGALWSEHCGYKHSKPLLRLLPSDSPRVLVPPGEENAGVVDLGGGLACALKIESHNHPSAVEPFQGAATGVGGIVRDILALGARPIALLNSLRFGPLDLPRNRRLFRGVVGGISWYGNCIGVPDVAGEVYFAPCYTHNPLVNAMCVGLLPRERLVRARAHGPGNLLVLVGAETGRDGIHGASGLASRTFEGERELRSAVQVGDPYLEKVLIEACLEAVDALGDGLVGLQDLGAAGLTSATVESAGRGGAGVVVDVLRVPRREPGMTPYEVMLSESQERMLLILRPEALERARRVFEKWRLSWAVVGRVTDDGLARVYEGDAKVAEVPVALLTDPPLYRLEGRKPEEVARLQAEDLSALPPPPCDPGEALLRLLASPDLASRWPIIRQYDHHLGDRTVVEPGQGDASVLWLRPSRRALAVCVDGNGRWAYADPYAGGALAVAEACRNLSCAGAEPLAITDGLNFGDPDRPEVYWQMEECIRGIADACRALGVPVVSGNVSLYNETEGRGIWPTPIVGAVGLLEEVEQACGLAFRREGDGVLLLGAREVVGDPALLGASALVWHFHGRVAGRPLLDLAMERRVQDLVRRLVRRGLVRSAHDCSDGGLLVALAECCLAGGLGFWGAFEVRGRWDAGLFGEGPARVVVSVPPEAEGQVLQMAHRAGVPAMRLGTVGGRALEVPGLLRVGLEEMRDAWAGGLERALRSGAV